MFLRYITKVYPTGNMYVVAAFASYSQVYNVVTGRRKEPIEMKSFLSSEEVNV